MKKSQNYIDFMRNKLKILGVIPARLGLCPKSMWTVRSYIGQRSIPRTWMRHA